MAAMTARQSRAIAAPPTACFAAICDFASYPDWQAAVRECVVEERDEAGRGAVVATVIDVKVRRIRYRLRYTYDAPDAVRWTYLDGDVRDISGEFLFEPAEDGGCIATYALAVDAGRFVPSPVRRTLEQVLMRGALHDLAKRVE